MARGWEKEPGGEFGMLLGWLFEELRENRRMMEGMSPVRKEEWGETR